MPRFHPAHLGQMHEPGDPSELNLHDPVNSFNFAVNEHTNYIDQRTAIHAFEDSRLMQRSIKEV